MCCPPVTTSMLTTSTVGMMTIIMHTKPFGLPNTKLTVHVTVHNTLNSRASCWLRFGGGHMGEMEITKFLGSLLPGTLCWKTGRNILTVYVDTQNHLPLQVLFPVSCSMPSLAKKLSALTHIFLLC
jgi:hypothetical protein